MNFRTTSWLIWPANPIQLDHQGRFTGSGGVSYDFSSKTPGSIRIFFMATACAPALRTLKNFPPIGRTMSAWSTSGICIPRAFSELKLRFDCLNLFDEVYEIRNGTGVGIAAPAYGPRRGFYGGLTLSFRSVLTTNFESVAVVSNSLLLPDSIRQRSVAEPAKSEMSSV